MALPSTYQRGIDEKVFVEVESTYGAVSTAIPAITAAIRHMAPAVIQIGDPKILRGDQRNTRSVSEYYTGKVSPGPWSLRSQVLPVDASTAPDVGDLIEAHMGGVAATNNYSLTETLTKTLRVWAFRGNESLQAVGAYVDQMVLDAPDNDSPFFEFSGPAARVVRTGRGGIASGTSGTDQLVLDSGHGARFEVGSLVKLRDAADATEVSHRITAIVTDTLTVTPNLTKTYDTTDDIYPDEPASLTLAGLPIPASRNSFTIGGSAVDIELVSFRLTSQNQGRLRTMERGKTYATGFEVGTDRDVRVEVALYGRQAVTQILEKARAATSMALVCTLGDTAGAKLVVTVSKWVPDVPSINEAERGDQIHRFTGRAMASSVFNDEYSIDFQ